MSLTDKKVTWELVEGYRRNNQKLSRPELRKLIRLENNITNPSELRKLDRYLKKVFDLDRQRLEKIAELQTKLSELKKYEWVASYLRLSDLIETEEDHQMLLDLIEKLDKKRAAEAWEEEQKFHAKIMEEEKKSGNYEKTKESWRKKIQ